MVRLSAFSAAGLGLLSSYAAAHPGEAHSAVHMKRELTARDNHAALGQRSLGACSNSIGARDLKARSIARRADKVQNLRKRKGIKTAPRKYRRDADDVETWEATNHNHTGTLSHDMFTPLETVFDANTSCILAPEVTDGPYYVVGEYMRSNVREALYSEGVDLFLEVQYVDVATCAPLPAVAVDVWNCNATGSYSGVSMTNMEADPGYNTTFLRGVQLTDHDGVAQFETIFPGHYDGRATHTHLLAHTNATVERNGTVSVWDAPVAHIGQLFYPETLIDAVEALAPYRANTVARTSNTDDMWSVLQADAAYDPFPHFVYLGDDVADGLFAWIQIGVNASADYTGDEYYNIDAYLDADGGHVYGSGSMGGGGGAGGGAGGPGPLSSSSLSAAAASATGNV